MNQDSETTGLLPGRNGAFRPDLYTNQDNFRSKRYIVTFLVSSVAIFIGVSALSMGTKSVDTSLVTSIDNPPSTELPSDIHVKKKSVYVEHFEKTNSATEAPKAVNSVEPVLQLLHSESVAPSHSAKPHILFLLLDDAGSNDFGYASGDLTTITPFIDELANKGIKLTRYYTEHSCTPSRATIFSGMSPMMTGTQHETIDVPDAWGLNISTRLLPSYLQALDYRTHLVGKWDIGHYAVQFWPTSRGFDTYFGFLGCCIDKFKHSKETVIDLHNGTNAASPRYYGIYGTYLWENTARDIIERHDVSHPLFLMVSFDAPHAVTKIPEGYNYTAEYRNATQGATFELRKKFAAAMRLADNAIHTIVSSLQQRGLYENTVIVCTSDNGAPTSASNDANGGSNWPYRGMKGTSFEGGIRVPAFVHSPLIGLVSRESHALFHVSDWLPTLVEGVAGGASTGLGPSVMGTGINQWDVIKAKNGHHALRHEIGFLIDYVSGKSGAILLGNYKYIHNVGCYGWFEPIKGDEIYSDGVDCAGADGNVSNRLYNIMKDPTESDNLYNMPEHADIQNQITSRWCEYFTDVMQNSQYREDEKDAMLAAAAKNIRGGKTYLTYWRDYPNNSTAYPKVDYTVGLCKHMGSGSARGDSGHPSAIDPIYRYEG